jgi:hypothetical protein
MARFIGSFIPNLGDLDSWLGDCGTHVKTNLSLSLIFRVNLRLGGYSI